MSGHYSFFQNKECEYFPCHKTDNPEDFNCLFCYCPLYCLGSKCGGNYRYNDKGIKDCTDCTFPHEKDHYSMILSRFPDIQIIAEENK